MRHGQKKKTRSSVSLARGEGAVEVYLHERHTRLGQLWAVGLFSMRRRGLATEIQILLKLYKNSIIRVKMWLSALDMTERLRKQVTF